MGVLTGLLLLPLTGPIRAFHFLVQRLHEEAEAVLRDEGRAFAELIELSMRRSAGQLTEAEFAEQETELLERLSSIREHRDELLQAASAADEDELLEDELFEDDLLEDEPLDDDALGDDALADEQLVAEES